MKYLMFILLVFLCIQCESYQSLTIHNHAFDGTVNVLSYNKHLDLGEQVTISIDEGVYVIGIVSDSVYEYRGRQWRKGVSDNIVIHPGANDYIFTLPVVKRVIEP